MLGIYIYNEMLTAEASERHGRGLLGATEEIKWFLDTYIVAKTEMFDIICSDKIDGL